MNIIDQPYYAEDLQLPGTREAGVLAQAEALIEDAVAAGGKVYLARISQTSTSAPTAVVVRNTLSGTPAWSRTAVGDYKLTLTGAFPLAKTLVLIGHTGVSIDDTAIFDIIRTEHTSANFIRLTTRYWQAGSIAMDDNYLLETEIYITVVP
jgi:hypothetical protein